MKSIKRNKDTFANFVAKLLIGNAVYLLSDGSGSETRNFTLTPCNF